ncbi:hypothetical protein PAHAL_9G472300 [Panicum hallii]|uniref:Bidirectional sugar transporter SWEET n=1 Tax=Panicum hallii TaxID=206008 RepID=A0A2S3IQR7_9POAL|nr:bidirectional sugar transporter SWEET16-like isoform X1 [Panicum hallii]PAN49742.1 hypothetical protein PAHAL_9G472300 [Panicum hallii]
MAADPSFVVGIIGNVISILVFASPIATFRRIVRNASTEDFRWLPYVTTLLSTSLWTFYGLLKPGGLLVVTVNGAGAALEAAYVTLYLIYAPRETKAKMLKLVLAVNVGFLAAVVVVTLAALHGGVRLLAVGVLCAALTIGMYAAPLGAMRTVVKTRSVEYMPFSLSFFLFLNGGVWSVYSVLVKDYFIGVRPQRHRLRPGHGAAGAVHGVPEGDAAAAQGGRRRRRRGGGRGGRAGAADDGAGGGDGAAAGAAAQGAQPAQAVGRAAVVVAAGRAREHHQVHVRHPRRAALRPAPARPRPVRARQEGRRRRGGRVTSAVVQAFLCA